jgi:hypothetical protein
MAWARACALHIVPVYGEALDARLQHAFTVAEAWQQGAASVKEARAAAVGAIAVANERTQPAQVAIARGIGQMVLPPTWPTTRPAPPSTP